MKDTIYPIDIATGEYVQGIQMTDEEERKRRKKYWELRNAKELRRIDHGPLGKFYLSACRSEQFEGLKPQDITRLIYLVSHLNYKSVLMLNERRKMTLTDLPAVLNVSDSTAKRFWDNVSFGCARHVFPWQAEIHYRAAYQVLHPICAKTLPGNTDEQTGLSWSCIPASGIY